MTSVSPKEEKPFPWQWVEGEAVQVNRMDLQSHQSRATRWAQLAWEDPDDGYFRAMYDENARHIRALGGTPPPLWRSVTEDRRLLAGVNELVRATARRSLDMTPIDFGGVAATMAAGWSAWGGLARASLLHHEAGHAVAMTTLGIKVLEVRGSRDGLYYVKSRPGAGGNFDQGNFAVGVWAGAIAARAACGTAAPGAAMSDGDRELLDQERGRLGRAWNVTGLYRRANNIVASQSRSIRAVAAALHHHERLSSDDVFRVMLRFDDEAAGATPT